VRWSFRLGVFAGIAVHVHATFALLLGWVALTHYLAGRSLAAAAGGVVFILAVFLCVLLHEFGHALAARRYGIPTRDITLLPIGGLARLARMPEDPRQELVVAIAGPAVNVVIAAGLLGGLAATSQVRPLEELGLARGSLPERLAVVNVWLVLFNMIPAFPMDGGRVLRALLATRLPYARATQIAASVGQGAALILGFVGLFTNPFLVFIAMLVWIGAGQEAGAVSARTALSGLPVRAAMLTEFHVLSPGDGLARAVDLLLRGSQTEFPVVDGGRVVGILRRNDLVKALGEGGPDTPVAQAMRRDFCTARAGEPLDRLFARLQGGECATVPVLDGERLVGLVTTENVGELLMVREALDSEADGR